MGFSSQSGQLLLRSQAVAGTYQADTGTAGVGIKLRGGSLGPNRELLIPDPEIGGGRDTTDAYLGAVSWSGDLDFYVRMKALPTLLRAALGGSTSATAAIVAPATVGVTTHTITPIDSGTLPFLSVEEKIGNGMEVYRYTDAVVNTLHLEADANGYLMGTVGLIAGRQAAGQTATPAPLFDNSALTVGTNITVTYNGLTLPAKSFSLDVNNNIEDDDFRLGSFFVGDFTAKQREVMMGVSIRPSDSALWRQATYGTAGATAPGGVTTKQQAVVTMSTYEFIPGTNNTQVYQTQITIPKAIIAPYGLEPSGDDVIENDLELRALRPDPGVAIMTTTVKTDQATIA